MEPDIDKAFNKILIRCAIVAIIIIGIIVFLSGCTLFKTSKSVASDTTSVKKEVQLSSKVDTSKSKSESAYIKETFIYPPRDTTINNFYNTTNPPAVYIRESGSKKEETNTAIFDNFRKEFLDSLAASKRTVATESKTKFGFSTFEIIILCAVGLIFLKQFGGPILNIITKK